jgi:uncharacterized protein
MRKKSPRTLILTASILLSVPVIFYLATGNSLDRMPTESVQDIMKSWAPGEDYIRSETEAFKGSWSEQMEFRVPASLEFHTFLFFLFFGWKVSGMMLLGMALFKKGILSGEKDRRYYLLLAIIGIAISISLSTIGVLKNFEYNWSFEYSMFLGSLYNYIASVGGSLGYIGLIMLFVNKKFMTFLFQKTGQMAFTNYLLQTIICTLIFYGHGFGLFGEINRLEQLGIVILVWVIIISFSRIWLSHFKYGPFEWLWRMMTYGKIFKIVK